MKRDELDQEPTMKKLYSLISPEPRTWATYLTSMMHYTNYTGMKPTELINSANADFKSGKLMIERDIFTLYPQFRQYLEDPSNFEKALAPGTLEKYVSTVGTFYKSFYIEIPNLPRSKRKVRPMKENLKRIKKEGIQQALEFASLRDRAMVLCGLSSGMGAAEISNLRLSVFKNGYDSETGIALLDMRRQKANVDFITFISAEASNAVMKYLEWRDRPPKSDSEKDVKEYERRKTSRYSYLFISASVNNSYIETYDEELRQCSSDAIVKAYSRISENAGMSTSKGLFNTFRSHNMRKYFNSTLKNKGCDSDLVEFFMGHTLGATKEAYNEYDPEYLLKIYKQFAPYLTIKKELDVATSPEYQELEKQNKIYQSEAVKHIVERGELADMYRRMSAMQKTINELEKFTDSKTMEKINVKAYSEAYRYVNSE